MNNRRFDIKPPEESLHWISYNLGQILKELRNITPLLVELSQTQPKQQPLFKDRPPMFRAEEEKIPF